MEIMKKIITILSILFIGAAAYSQSAQVVTEIIDAPKVTYGQICYLSAVSQNLISESASYEEAVKALADKGIISEQITPDTEITLSNLAYIYAQMFNIKGGLMFRLTKGSPRYAFKQMKSDGVISQNYDPSLILSGREALNIYTSCNMLYNEDEFAGDL